jgi:hypothetical protein
MNRTTTTKWLPEDSEWIRTGSRAPSDKLIEEIDRIGLVFSEFDSCTVTARHLGSEPSRNTKQETVHSFNFVSDESRLIVKATFTDGPFGARCSNFIVTDERGMVEHDHRLIQLLREARKAS